MVKYCAMSNDKPQEAKEGTDTAEGCKPKNPADQNGSPSVTVTVQVHWPGHP